MEEINDLHEKIQYELQITEISTMDCFIWPLTLNKEDLFGKLHLEEKKKKR